MKNVRRSLFIAFITALMVAALAVPAFAAVSTKEWWNTTVGYQEQNIQSAYNSSSDVTVPVLIHSNKVGSNSLDLHYSVTVPVSTTHAVTVAEVIDQLMDDHTNLHFQKVTALSGGEPSEYADISSSDYSFYRIYDTATSTSYAPPSYLAKTGWMVKINKKFVLENGSSLDPYSISGADIGHTYVKSGYVIDLFYDDVSDQGDCAYFTRVSYGEYNTSTKKLKVTVDYATDYFGPALAYPWYISSYGALYNATVNIIDSTGDVKATGTTNSSGEATISISSLSAGPYRIDVAPTWKTNGIAGIMHSQAHFTKNSNNTVSWGVHE